VDNRLKRAAELEAEAALLREEYKNNPPVAVRTPYLIEDDPGRFRVGSKDEPQIGDYPYSGPCAHVYGDENWVYVETDSYEGCAMINREALPMLIEALTRLEAHLNATSDESRAISSGFARENDTAMECTQRREPPIQR
jgi:hypothetical protein